MLPRPYLGCMTAPLDSTTLLSAPPPWTLEGHALVCLARARDGRRGLLAFARYTASPVGPYDEVFWVSGRLPPLSVDAIRVSTGASVEAGRRNWGIPKQLGAFSWEETGLRWAVTVEAPGADAPFARVAVEGFGPAVPLTGRLLPKLLRRFEQVWEGRRYRFEPGGAAHVRPARLREGRVDGEGFPNLEILAAAQVEGLRLVLPEPTVERA